MIAMYIAVLDLVLPHRLIVMDFVINNFDLSSEEAVHHCNARISAYIKTLLSIGYSGYLPPFCHRDSRLPSRIPGANIK